MIAYVLIFSIIVLSLWIWYCKGIAPKINTNRIIVKKVMKNAIKWTAMAKQDSDPLMALLHANYGAAYVYALKDSVGQKHIIKNFPDFDKYEKEIMDTQELAAKIFTNNSGPQS